MRYTVDDFTTEDMREAIQAYYARLSSPRRMQDSWQAPFRDHIVEAVRTIMPIQSLYEVGCGSGPNLRRLSEAFPGLRLGGCDFAEPLAAAAAEWADIEVRGLPCEVGPEWDATLSSYAMAYLNMQELLVSLKQIRSRYLILAEPMLTHGGCALIYGLDGGLPFWSHDYLPFLAGAGWTSVITWDIPDGPDNLNRMLIVQRGA